MTTVWSRCPLMSVVRCDVATELFREMRWRRIGLARGARIERDTHARASPAWVFLCRTEGSRPDDALLVSERRRRGAIGNVQFEKDVAHVTGDRFLADPKR